MFRSSILNLLSAEYLDCSIIIFVKLCQYVTKIIYGGVHPII